MAPTYTAVISQDGPWWVGWVEEVPGVNAQEESREQLLGSLRVVLREALEFNREEARQAAGPAYEELARPSRWNWMASWIWTSTAWTGFKPNTPVQEGVARFVAWYREFDGV